MGKLYTCAFCDETKDTRAHPYDECADCKRGGCEQCLTFAELPGYPLCQKCALAREEQEHASTTAPPRSAPELPSSEEVS